MTPEEIYALAEMDEPAEVALATASAYPFGQPAPAIPPELRNVLAGAAGASLLSAASSVEPDSDWAAQFRRLVERVTEVLAAQLELPAFREWAESYREAPARYDEELLGLWREQLDRDG